MHKKKCNSFDMFDYNFMTFKLSFSVVGVVWKPLRTKIEALDFC